MACLRNKSFLAPSTQKVWPRRKDDDVAAFTRTRVSPAVATTPHSGECGYTNPVATTPHSGECGYTNPVATTPHSGGCGYTNPELPHPIERSRRI